jgi:hypothetical protein
MPHTQAGCVPLLAPPIGLRFRFLLLCFVLLLLNKADDASSHTDRHRSPHETPANCGGTILSFY